MTGAEIYLGYLHELTELSEQAEAAARQQNWDELVACLSRRQTIMDQVDALADDDRNLTPDQRLRATSLLERVAQLDAMSSAVVDTALSSTRSVLQEGTQARAGISAYRRASAGGPVVHEARFVDKNR
ncbi:MAG TPA: flagellar protein FliT [Symbiobacteriaceae bacterium]|nr:flagellar protein FliT [Symbiobacteriaceae bacterium]